MDKSVEKLDDSKKDELLVRQLNNHQLTSDSQN